MTSTVERITAAVWSEDLLLTTVALGILCYFFDETSGRECVCGRSLTGIVGSNLAGGMDVCLL